jgi:hypothetical protein
MAALPRLPRFLLAGLLLLTAVLLLTGLFAQPSYRWVGVSAAAAFIPLWYAVSVVNTWIGVASAGYPLRAEAPVFVAVFGVPAAVAGALAWASRARWDGGPIVHTGRMPVIVVAGLALWAAIVLLAGLLAQAPSFRGVAGPALVAFAPLWLLICLVNLGIGVTAAGYGVLEETPILLANAALPIAIAFAAYRLAGRRTAVAGR